VHEFIDLPHPVKIGVGNRAVEEKRPNGDCEIVGEDAQESASRISAQLLKLRQYVFDIQRLPRYHRAIGMSNRRPVQPPCGAISMSFHGIRGFYGRQDPVRTQHRVFAGAAAGDRRALRQFSPIGARRRGGR
jgi:hypothetical protein